MTIPSPQDVFDVLDATWPPARIHDTGDFWIREGRGGGQRVSAATQKGQVDANTIDKAEDCMIRLGQRPLFMVRSEDDFLDAMLEMRGYEVVDPVQIYACRLSAITTGHPAGETLESWPPLAIQTDIWREGGIDAARVDVMMRATCPHTSILARAENRPVATVYVGALGQIAMLHALETRTPLRRRGAGTALVVAAGRWASRIGAEWMTLAVTKANEPANALYRSLGMDPLTNYHYRRAPERTG